MQDIEFSREAFLWFIDYLYPYILGHEQEKRLTRLRQCFQNLPESIPAFQNLRLFLELDDLCILLLPRLKSGYCPRFH